MKKLENHYLMKLVVSKFQEALNYLDHPDAFAFLLVYVLICQFLRVAVHLWLEIMSYFKFSFQG